MDKTGGNHLNRRDFLVKTTAATAGIVAAPALASATAEQALAAAPQTRTHPAKVDLVLWSHQFTPREVLDRVHIKEFEQKYPWVTVKYSTFPTDFETKLLTAMASGTGPDLFNLSTLYADPLVAGNAVVPVDASSVGFASDSALVNAYLPGFLNGFTWNNKLYALPTEVSNYALYINKLHFHEAGLDPAKDYPRTWDDLFRVARKLTISKGGKIVRRGFEFEYGSANDWTSTTFDLAGMAYQYGGRVYNADKTASLVNTSPWVKALTVYSDYVHKAKLGYPAMQVDAVDFTNGKEGNVSMLLSGYWYAASVQGTNKTVYKNIATAPFPRFANATHSNGALLYSYAHFVNASISADKQKLAWRLIGMLDSHPDQYLGSAGLLQPRKVLLDTASYRSNKLIKPFLADARTTPYFPSDKNSSEVLAALQRAVQRSTQTSVSPQKSLDQAKQDIDKILKGV